MMVYILKSSLCLALLWIFYKLFLEEENLHHFKRFFLLFSLIFAYTIPLITITYETDTIVEVADTQSPVTYVISSTEVPIEKTPEDYLSILLWAIYGVGFLVFTIRFIMNLSHLFKKVRINEKEKEHSHINVLLADTIIPHTFMKYIFVSKKEFQQKNIPQEVMMHEKTHVQQKHTLDILFVEIFQIIFWFNPLWFWIKKSIKLNHEFLADQKVLNQEFSILEYMNILVNYPSSPYQAVIASSINYSLTKKRIVMMSQQFSKTRTTVRLLLLVPLLLGCMLLFNNKMIAQQKSMESKTAVAPTHPDKKIKIRIQNEQILVNGTATKLAGFAGTIDQVTQQWKDSELTEFQFDVQIMNSKDEFVQKLNQAYKKTRLYKANPDNHDLIPPPPPLPEVPVIKSSASNKATAPVSPKNKHIIVPPPPPTSPAEPSPVVDIDIEEINKEIAQALQEVEQVHIEAAVEKEIAMEEIERAISEVKHAQIEKMIDVEQIEQEVEMAIAEVEYAQNIAIEASHAARDRAHMMRDRAIRNAESQRHEARERVMIHAKKAREQARVAMKEAEHTRAKAYKKSEKARKQAEKARRKALDAARKVRNEARKEAMEVRKEAIEARKEAQKARMEAQKARNEILEKNRERR
ncbi:M56 family metallopeptidase [Aquimarina sp. I32.4]|uniref:M56 family metallopeptidase n=1 Tax=Aquimarina sp. I32.4 TaxID=2053903 RepID=UPI000CDEE091|nr:M56 family metallopeptidase [Aquimarina sp. I32.4]